MKSPTTCLFILLIAFSACKSDDSGDSSMDENVPSEAIAIYNQAYQENFEADNIQDIIATAQNAYVLIDPFEDNVHASVSAIQANGNEVGAYISIGTGENWRLDFDELEPFLVPNQWGQWAGEYFVNSTTTGALDIMKARIDQIAEWGCDWVEFDNMDWVFDDEYRAIYGFVVTIEEGKDYYQTLCGYVHLKGMKCMAKNTVEGAGDFDGVLYESYHDERNWWDTSGAQLFLNEGKLVIVNHYNETDCDAAYAYYKGVYNQHLSFICEDVNLERYVHFNQ